MYWLSRILSWLLYTAVIAFMIFALCANFLIITQGLFEPFSIVKGGSMEPVIRENDAVYLTSPDTAKLSVGDIVVFSDPEDYNLSIVHRIVDMQEENGEIYAITKGDANEVEDPFMIPVDSIYGKVRLIIPSGGLFLSYLRSVPGFITCVLCPFVVLLLYLLAKWYLEKAEPGTSVLALKLLPDSRR